jgi:hypothetical protein
MYGTARYAIIKEATNVFHMSSRRFQATSRCLPLRQHAKLELNNMSNLRQ